jgi:hypothetical protein
MRAFGAHDELSRSGCCRALAMANRRSLAEALAEAPLRFAHGISARRLAQTRAVPQLIVQGKLQRDR